MEHSRQRTERNLFLSLGVGFVRTGWLPVLAGLIGLFILSNYILPLLRLPDLEIYVIRPLLWLALAYLVFWFWRRESGNQALPLSRPLVATALIIGALQVAIMALAGIFIGFGNSPYSRRIYLVILNLWYVASQLIGLEMTRWYFVRRLGRRWAFLGIISAWVIITLIDIPLAGWRQMGDVESAFRFSGTTLLPGVSENLLATFLAFTGGPLPAIAYRGVLALFEWGSPILPDLNWLMTAFIGTLVPIIGLLVVYQYYFVDTAVDITKEETAADSRPATGWFLVVLLAVSLFWFNSGLFGVRPTLVSGFSMKPAYVAGDIVITRDVPAAEIQVGDVVRFREGGVYIIHRVKEIQQEGSRLSFITRGDNNNVDDAPVSEEQLSGKVVFFIPKIGWIAIGVRRAVDFVWGVFT